MHCLLCFLLSLSILLSNGPAKALVFSNAKEFTGTSLFGKKQQYLTNSSTEILELDEAEDHEETEKSYGHSHPTENYNLQRLCFLIADSPFKSHVADTRRTNKVPLYILFHSLRTFGEEHFC